MIDNKNLPAFPVLELKQMGDKLLLDCAAPGVSKLEFFACNAPCEIPGFFKHTPPVKKITPMPEWHTLPKESQELIKLWHTDGQELPEELKWFSEQYKKHEQEDKEYRLADHAARYFQWRRYYAENLLSELSKS